MLDGLRRRFWDRTHEMGGGTTGTEDPNIVGDAGPFDVAPGRDPEQVTEVEREVGVRGVEVTDDVLPPEEPDAEERRIAETDAASYGAAADGGPSVANPPPEVGADVIDPRPDPPSA